MAKEIVSGKHKTVNGWDGMHRFGSGDSTWANLHGWIQFGSIGTGKIPKALQSFYKKYNLNPCITSVKFTVDPVKFTVDWEFTIEESPDGKAYVGFSSWGGASGGYPGKPKPASHAYTNYKKEYDAAVSKVTDTTIAHVIDFNFPGGFRQIFFQHTWPKKYPNLPKSAGLVEGTVGVEIGPKGSPADLPDYNGVLVKTVKTPDTQKPAETLIVGSASTIEEPIKKPDPVSPFGKLVIKKKSGPGEITGDVEVDIVDLSSYPNATFKGLQFTEGGDYELIITGTNPDVFETKTLKIKVNKEPDVIEQPESKGDKQEEKNLDGTRPGHQQIDKPTIKIPTIEMDQSGSSQQQQYIDHIGVSPFVWYNGVQIKESQIKNLRLWHEGIIPMVKFTFSDQFDIMTKFPPKDDTTMDLFINSSSDYLKCIHFKFKITEFNRGAAEAGQTVTIAGSIDVPDLYLVKSESYNGTSFDVLRELCKKMGLGFNSNIDKTNDSMSWKRTQMKPYEFIDEILEHSYIDDESYMSGYIDYYYCFNYVDIEKEMKRDNSKDVGLNTAAIAAKDQSDDTKRVMPILLSNDKSFSGSSNYIMKYKTINDSTKKSLQQGYLTITKAYDRIKKSFLIFKVDSTTSDGTNTEVLKGSKGDSKFFEENIKTNYTGKLDTDNAHGNYNYAKTQNKINLVNLNKIVLLATLSNPNFNLYKFQKVKVLLNKDTPTPISEPTDFRFSGDYIIADIEYVWNGTTFMQELRLVRKEIGKLPEEVKNDPAPAPKKDTKENNTNPETTVTLPNSVYTIGQVLLVKDANSNLFEITISSLSTDGKEVTATVKDLQKKL